MLVRVRVRVCVAPGAQQVPALLGKKWQQRWCAIVPNGLLVFGDKVPPKMGTAAKQVIPLEYASLEGVEESEAKRPFTFALVKGTEVCGTSPYVAHNTRGSARSAHHGWALLHPFSPLGRPCVCTHMALCVCTRRKQDHLFSADSQQGFDVWAAQLDVRVLSTPSLVILHPVWPSFCDGLCLEQRVCDPVYVCVHVCVCLPWAHSRTWQWLSLPWSVATAWMSRESLLMGLVTLLPRRWWLESRPKPWRWRARGVPWRARGLPWRARGVPWMLCLALHLACLLCSRAQWSTTVTCLLALPHHPLSQQRLQAPGCLFPWCPLLPLPPL